MHTYLRLSLWAVVALSCLSLTGCAQRVAMVGKSVGPDGGVTRYNPELQQPEDDPSPAEVVSTLGSIVAGLGGPVGLVGGLLAVVGGTVARAKHGELVKVKAEHEELKKSVADPSNG